MSNIVHRLLKKPRSRNHHHLEGTTLVWVPVVGVQLYPVSVGMDTDAVEVDEAVKAEPPLTEQQSVLLKMILTQSHQCHMKRMKRRNLLKKTKTTSNMGARSITREIPIFPQGNYAKYRDMSPLEMVELFLGDDVYTLLTDQT